MEPATVTPEATPVQIPALPATGEFAARSKASISDVSGAPVVDLSMVPGLLISRSMAALRKAPEPPRRDAPAMIAEAVELFGSAEIGGVSPSQYQHLTTRISGAPIAAIGSAVTSIVNAGKNVGDSLSAAAPNGVVTDWLDPSLREGGAIWTRRGETLAVHAPGNTPSVHASWLPALALGYRVAIRPSRRDPLTPHRLISALRRAGFGDDQVTMLPAEHQVADELLREADLSIVYGGDAVMAKYAADPTVLALGPGRAKLLIAKEFDWRDHLEAIVQSIQAGGGAYCGNVTGVLVEGDAGELAEAIAERLRPLPSLPPEDERACLPVKAIDDARALESHLLTSATGARIWLGEDGIADDLGDGSAALRPAVMELGSATDERLTMEMPFPCVWLAPWSRSQGVAPLRHSLRVTALTRDPELGTALIADPTIANVNLGAIPTGRTKPGLPHDDYLASFLMRAKTVTVQDQRADARERRDA